MGQRRPTWISWHWHQRTATIVRLWEIEWIMLDTRRTGFARYVTLLARSTVALWRLRGSTVIVQSPSVALAALASLLAPVLRLRVAVDAHNEAVEPFTHDTRWMRQLLRFTIRRVHRVIVTNDELALKVADAGGIPSVLPDALPIPPAGTPAIAAADPARVLIVCTYAADEPVDVFVEAATRLGPTVKIGITGRPPTAVQRRLSAAPRNLEFLGRLPEQSYWQAIQGARAVVDLTLKKNCLVCGAYEAIAAGRIPVLSDDISARRLFADVAVFVSNDADSLARGITQALSMAPPDWDAFRARYTAGWRRRFAALQVDLDGPD